MFNGGKAYYSSKTDVDGNIMLTKVIFLTMNIYIYHAM